MRFISLALLAGLALSFSPTASAACEGDNCSLPDDDTVRALARGVGRIDILLREGAGYCSGFVVAPTIVATSWHCVPGKMQVDGYPTALISGILLDYTAKDGQGAETRYLYFDPRMGSEGFGVSFLQLIDPKAEFEEDRVMTLSAEPREPGQPLAALVHEKGAPMRYVIDGCAVTEKGDAGDDVVLHNCAIGDGAPGAPLLDPDSGEVVAIHLSVGKDGSSRARSAAALLRLLPPSEAK
ncbi:trypsin-like serine peptidase [Antarctobacter heliothermus]|uniref:Trypsin-like peptidase domain-containing protein n=1 Tax=Antarctobacter heliothermus TaxID=74033 RepID=A0A239EMY7_9RHOB|nr:serine protease [Antarctobacter heliothermus]SNS45393.1 Trypsin-like peptidase domain-containing protein [Antarctobacter heliothermus]